MSQALALYSKCLDMNVWLIIGKVHKALQILHQQFWNDSRCPSPQEVSRQERLVNKTITLK